MRLINESEESLSCQPLTDLISLTLSIGPKNHVILETKIQFQNTHLNLTKLQVMKVALTLATYSFPEIEIEHECDPESHVSDSISLFNSIMTSIFLPDFFLYSGVNIESCVGP